MVYRANSRRARSIYTEKSYLKKRKTTTTTTKRSEECLYNTHNRVFLNREEQTHVVCGEKDRTGDAIDLVTPCCLGP